MILGDNSLFKKSPIADLTRTRHWRPVSNRPRPPAMHKQLAAERIRRADIVTADGFREKTKTEAEGAMQAKVAIASGQIRSIVGDPTAVLVGRTFAWSSPPSPQPLRRLRPVLQGHKPHKTSIHPRSAPRP